MSAQKIKVLNLYCGIGGNRRLWDGVDVTAVDNYAPVLDVYKKNFADDNVIQADASEYLEANFREFDFIWTSPPCQTHSKMQKATRHKKRKIPDMSLYGHILFLQHFFKGSWAVENVNSFYRPLIKPTVTLGRHFFWASCPIEKKDFERQENFIYSDSPAAIAHMKSIYGIEYEKNIYFTGNHSPGQVLRNCVSPDIGLYVFDIVCKQNK